MKLGDTIFVYESHGRREKSLEEHLANWKEYKIDEETRVSWIASCGTYSWCKVKIDKKSEQSRGKERIATSSRDEIVRQYEEWQWRSMHAYRMADRLRFVKDVEVLRKVAELIGYDPKVEK